MCKRRVIITVAGLALGSLLLAGSPAGAQSVYGPSVDQREAYQQHRIQQGINSGELTPGETRYLEREQGRIDRAEDRMLADGNLSPRERQRLNQMQNRASRDINRLENNNRTTAGYNGNQGWQGNNQGWSGHTNSGWSGNTNDPRFDRREAYQQQRIQQGINSGSLTPGEARYLEREQGRIDRAEGRMLADGNLSPQERQRLNQMQNHASRDINRLENNNRTTAGYNGNQGWHGNNPVAAGHNPGGPGYNHGWQGNPAHNGQPGVYQHPGAQAGTRPGQPSAWQGQQQYGRPSPQGAPQMRPGQPTPWQGQQYQQARMQAPQTQMRPNIMAPRQPSGGMVSRASFAAPRRR